MLSRIRKNLTVAVMITTAAMCGAASAEVEYHFVEDFSTTQYKDPVNTTARWDTVAGTLGLHPFEVQALGSLATTGQPKGVAVAGDIVYVADGSAGLKVIDATDPTNPILIGSAAPVGTAKDLVVDGDFLYMAMGTDGLAVYDITAPASPFLLRQLPLAADAKGLDYEGDLLCVAGGSGGLLLVNITLPASCFVARVSSVPTAANDVELRGDVVYVADGAAGLITIDISNVALPTVLATLATGGSAEGIRVDGSIAYIADGTNGFVTLWVEDPSLLYPRSQINTPGTALDVEVFGDFAYVCDDAGGLHVFDVTYNPVLEHTYTSASTAMAVAQNTPYVYLAEANGLTVLSVAEEFPPALLHVSPGPCERTMIVDGNHLYCSVDGVYTDWINVYDITNPASVIPAYSYFDTEKNFWAFAIQGNYLYACTQPEDPYGAPHRLQIYDITNPTVPVLVGTLNNLSWFGSLVPHGNYLFSSEYTFNIADPTSPSISLPMTKTMTEIVVHGNYLIGSGAPSGSTDDWYMIYDITVPAAPSYMGAPVDLNWPMGITIFGNTMLIGDLHYYYSLDITTPTAPVITTIMDQESYGGRLPLVAGDDSYYLTRNIIHTIDISDPAIPVVTDVFTDYSNLDYPESNLMHGDLLIVGTGGDTAFWKMFQRDYFYDDNIGQSTEIDSEDLTIVRAKVTASGDASILWALSSDDGANWGTADPAGVWHRIAQPGNALRWRSEHPMPPLAGDVAANQVEIEWRYEGAVIDSITDVPGDQGGWVRVHFTRSGYDFADEPTAPISYYEIVRVSDGQSVLTVFASTEDKLTARVPTLTDGTPTAFRIDAHSLNAGMSFPSLPDSGVSVDDLAPGVPPAFVVEPGDGEAVRLAWEQPDAVDVASYRVYRGTESDFALDAGTRVAETTDRNWTDRVNGRGVYFYKLTSVDRAGNESEPAVSGPVRVGDGDPMPDRFALYQNHPNPFNPTTLIAYDVASGGGHVKIQVFDVGGRLVRTLVDGEMTAGRKSVEWDGRDRNDRQVASGVYFYRLEAAGFARTLKMTLIQ